MGVSAELEIYTCLLSLFQMIRLMVQKDGKTCLSAGQLRQRFPSWIASVIPSDNGQPAYLRYRVPQQGYPGIGEESLGISFIADILVITEHGKDRGFNAGELFSVIPLQ